MMITSPYQEEIRYEFALQISHKMENIKSYCTGPGLPESTRSNPGTTLEDTLEAACESPKKFE